MRFSLGSGRHLPPWLGNEFIENPDSMLAHDAIKVREGVTWFAKRRWEEWECDGCGLAVRIQSSGIASIKAFSDYFDSAHSGWASLYVVDRTMKTMLLCARTNVEPLDPTHELFYPVKLKFYEALEQ